jgi:Xaa-Pro aminopeptidase
MSQLPDNSIAIIPAARHQIMTNDIFYPYRQSSDFYYLSGFQEPSAVLLFEKTGTKNKFVMFVQNADPQSVLWHGPRCGVSNVKECFDADMGYSIEELRDYLLHLRASNPTVLYNNVITDEKIQQTIATIFHGQNIYPSKPIIEKMRVIKSPSEIELLSQSCQISSKAFEKVMRWTTSGVTQHQLHAFFEYECRRKGSARLGYVPVVASGEDNCTLHYIQNDMEVHDGDLILMDAGGEYHHYSSDITRTWPVTGKFTDTQRLVYEQVLHIQENCIEAVRPGTSLAAIHQHSVMLAQEALKKLNLSPKDYMTFYPHSIGHWLGMDIHDVNSVNTSEALRPGMVLTIEPGLYFPNLPSIPEELRGIGIRIEDDILVTNEHPEVLTKGAPKQIDHIEDIIATSV